MLSSPSDSPHAVQLALWGQDYPLDFSIKRYLGVHFDKASISISDSTDDDKPRVTQRLTINGRVRPISSYPTFRAFKKRSIVNDLPSFAVLPTRADICPYCRIEMKAFEQYKPGPEGADRSAGELLEYCYNCMFWQVHGLRVESFEARSTILFGFDISVLSSKLREFDTESPEGSLSEISQWLRRKPEKYHTMSPRYLELLVARVFKDLGIYTEVHHVGRPGDGGVDVILVDSENRTWLVQVKRREDAHSTESVSTIRNVLGSMVLGGARHSIVVSTADHFTYQARKASTQAQEKGFTVELMNRQALDLIIGRSMPAAPWSPILEELRESTNIWVNEDWCWCGCTNR